MSKASGNAALREQLETLQDSLRAFDDPLVEELPGLRLMAETLQERERHIRDTIRRNETCSVELVLTNVAVEDEAVPAALLVAVLAALDAAVAAAALRHVRDWSPPPAPDGVAAAVALHVAQVGVDGDVTVKLARRPGELAAQPADPDLGVPLFEVAVSAVTEVLAAFCGGATEALPEELRAPCGALAQAVVDGGAVVRWSLEPFMLDPAEVTISQSDARRLLEAAGD